jgi:hypothetical protein
MAGERRVVTPDGRVWHVRRRQARRRLPWFCQPGQPTARFDLDQELPAEEAILPPLDGLFSYRGNDLDHLGERGFARRHDERHAARTMVMVLVVGFVVVGVLSRRWSTTCCPGSSRSWSPMPGRSWVSPRRWSCWSSSTAGSGPGSWSSSGRALPTLHGGPGASRDGGAAGAWSTSSPLPSGRVGSTASAPPSCSPAATASHLGDLPTARCVGVEGAVAARLGR